MDEIYFNTSQNEIYDYTNDYDYYNYYVHVATCIIIAISLPLILMAICSLYSLVQKDNVAPISLINLLISDLIQLCGLIVMEALRYQNTYVYWLIFDIFYYIHIYGVVVSVGFMVCIALERYLVIAHPLWYRFSRTVKISAVVCVFVWVLPLAPIVALLLWARLTACTFLAVFLLPPLPLFIFFLGGTLKALSASRSVPTEEKRRIVWILVLVLLMYTLLFLPFIIGLFFVLFGERPHFLTNLSSMLLKLSPLADLVLYIFMRKGAIDKFFASLCCCRIDNNDDNRSSV